MGYTTWLDHRVEGQWLIWITISVISQLYGEKDIFESMLNYLFVFILSLGLDYYWHTENYRQQFSWFERYLQWLHDRLGKTLLWHKSLGLVTVILPIVILVALLYYLLNLLLFGLFGTLFAIFLVWYCVDFQGFRTHVAAYAASPAGGARDVHLNNMMLESELKKDGSETEQVIQTIFLQFHERLLAIVFWFCVLGPVGCVLYRLCWVFVQYTGKQSSPYHHFDKWLKRLHGLLAWLPARLGGLSYILVGNFLPGFTQWVQLAKKSGSSRELLVTCGQSAIGISSGETADEADIPAALSLTWRSGVIWLIVIILLSLAPLRL